jgi:hypothetical protein
MASPVNRRRRKKAFERGFNRPQGMNPYRNAVLARLWGVAKEKRLAKTGGVMPAVPPPKNPRPSARPGGSPARGRTRPDDRGGGVGGRGGGRGGW